MGLGCPECGSLTGEHLPQCTWRDRHPAIATISLDGCTVNPEWAAKAMSDALCLCSEGKLSFDDELAKKVFGAVAETFNMVLRDALRLHAHVTAPIRFANQRWDDHFLRLCVEHANMSKDPSTRVGAVIVGPDQEIRSTGFNGFPRRIADTEERLNDRDVKISLVVHAEMNAILNAARIGVAVKGCTLYLAATDSSGAIWGGAPCTRCAVEIIQSGISEIVSLPFKASPSKWEHSVKTARSLLEEAGVLYREVAP